MLKLVNDSTRGSFAVKFEDGQTVPLDISFKNTVPEHVTVSVYQEFKTKKMKSIREVTVKKEEFDTIKLEAIDNIPYIGNIYPMKTHEIESYKVLLLGDLPNGTYKIRVNCVFPSVFGDEKIYHIENIVTAKNKTYAFRKKLFSTKL